MGSSIEISKVTKLTVEFENGEKIEMDVDNATVIQQVIAVKNNLKPKTYKLEVAYSAVAYSAVAYSAAAVARNKAYKYFAESLIKIIEEVK